MGCEENGVLLLNLWASPFAMSCAIALKEKGVHFSCIEEDIPYHKSKLLLHSNPIFKEVPVLIHNDKAVCESLVILEYIEDAWPSPDRSLLPSDPYQRAVARFWADFGNKKFIETGLKLMKKVGEEYEAARREIVEYFTLFEAGMSTSSSEGPFFFGKNLTLPDIVMASLVCWMRTYESLGNLKFCGADKCPRMHRWLAAMRELPSAKSTVPDDEKLLKHCTSFRQAVLDATAASETR